MKIAVRRNVFETNSSSCHSIVMKNIKRRPSEFELTKRGILKIELGEFGREEAEYDDQYTKLQYLCTLVFAHYNSYGIKQHDFKEVWERVKDDDYFWEYRLEKPLIEYIPGMKKLEVLPSDWSIDHNSLVDPEEFLNGMDPLDFIFDDNIILRTEEG